MIHFTAEYEDDCLILTTYNNPKYITHNTGSTTWIVHESGEKALNFPNIGEAIDNLKELNGE